MPLKVASTTNQRVSDLRLQEVPFSILLRRFKPHRVITISLVCWSIIMVCMGLVHNFGGLVTTRLLLGLAENILFPGCNVLVCLTLRPLRIILRSTLVPSSRIGTRATSSTSWSAYFSRELLSRELGEVKIFESAVVLTC